MLFLIQITAEENDGEWHFFLLHLAIAISILEANISYHDDLSYAVLLSPSNSRRFAAT
ncbi:MAG: hypothetical protein AAFV28_11990 [Cyanobacteria bacterium J06635_13]